MKKENRIMGAGGLTAIGASLCCITPLLALLAGTGGIASAFSWIEPVRPFLIGLTVLIIGFAWYQKLKPGKADDCNCGEASKQKNLRTKIFLRLATAFAIIMMAFPYYAKIFYPTKNYATVIIDKSSIQVAEFKIQGMNCIACEAHIKYEIGKLAGIVSADIYYAKENAVIKFNKSQINIKAIEKKIDTIGYQVTQTKME